MAIQNFFTSRDNKLDGNTYVGQLGRLWYNPDTNSIYASDGSTVGGIPVDLATGANAVFDNITVNGNIAVIGNISPASNIKIGGVRAGPGANIGTDGLLTIDTANLPLSFGNFTASNNVLTIVNVDEDMILQTQGSAEIQLIGNIGFYKPDGLPPNTANRYFQASEDGQVAFYVPTSDPLAAAVKIIGSASGLQVNPAVAGVMLHITGQPNAFSTIYNDGSNSFPNFIGRRYNGNTAAPTQVLSGQQIVRFSGQGYTSSGFSTAASGTISLDALEDFTSTNQGTTWRFLNNALNGNTRLEVANVSVANGVTATKFNTSGNITGGNVTVVGNICYDSASNNAVVTQLTSKSTAVTANGRSGQITTNAAALAQGTSVSFTVNNSYVAGNDVVILNIKSGATPDTYQYGVANVNNGNFVVQLRNFTNSSQSDAIVFNFAVIKLI